MDFNSNLESEYHTMAELTEEIGTIVQKSINEGREDLSSTDIKYILKITSNVTKKINSKIMELVV
ncbi:hypothetical protein BD31_I1850 [Candidatus Nitrosopumilus salaria BD31]|uniref:Uncharacterized protein n=1 Tax=Candidatus Nitrosopumilus salarius BD31 TaxID=859350 RepID=I3D4K8_9ARCH|nr:hypothetical protein [Candidatus Nitrosopumilus salaria]EIJ66651.1 hypothetical protein BD31_I1850 [Candidatus Nitrosopumilus salaria BD31]